MEKREENIYHNLLSQIKKIAKHNRQGSFKTKERYFQATSKFCKFLAKEFGVQKFSNIKDKHIEAYIKDMQNRNLSASTIKTNLSAIRFFYDKSGNAKNIISENEKFELEKRTFGGVDRGWTMEEFKAFLKLCDERNMFRVKYTSLLARYDGVRLHEAVRINRSDVEKALKTGDLHIKGKNGKERDVPLSDVSKKMLDKIIPNIPRGAKLFVKENEKSHLVMKNVQNWINQNRKLFQEDNRDINITFHGLRHTYAKEKYDYFISIGLDDYTARKRVSRLLGHERDDVTRIYI